MLAMQWIREEGELSADHSCAILTPSVCGLARERLAKLLEGVGKALAGKLGALPALAIRTHPELLSGAFGHVGHLARAQRDDQGQRLLAARAILADLEAGVLIVVNFSTAILLSHVSSFFRCLGNGGHLLPVYVDRVGLDHQQTWGDRSLSFGGCNEKS